MLTGPRRRVLRIALATIAALLVLIVGGVGIVLFSIDANDFKPRIVAAVKRATGRELLLNGPIHLDVSLWPSLRVTDVAFANPPDFSRPMMATFQRLDLQLALLPLLRHRIEIERFVLVAPDLVLETNAAGQTNWEFPAHARAQDDDDSGPARIGLRDVRLEGGTIAYRDARSGRGVVLDVTRLQMEAASPGAPLHLAMQARANGAPFALTGDVGPLDRLQDPAPGVPWPITLRLDAGAATATIEGTIGHLAKGRLFDLRLTGHSPDFVPLAVFLPETRLPALRDASVAIRVIDNGTSLELDAALRVAGAGLTANGTIADMSRLAGVNIALAVTVENLAAFGTPGRPLPAVRSIDIRARLTEADGGLAQGVALRDIAFLSSSADIAGDAVAGFSPRPSLRARLIAARIDADDLRGDGGDAAAAKQQTAAPATSAIPDTPLPLHLLRAADADVELTVAALHSRGALYHAIAARMSLQNGQLRLSPLTADLPEGRLTGTLSADVTRAVPLIDLTLHAPGLAVEPLLKALHLPEEAAGRLRVSLELQGSGTTPHAIAASVNGHLGLAMARGTVSNWLLAHTVGWALREVALPDLATDIGTTELRCFALRLDLSKGVGTLNSLLIDSTLLYLDGSGTLHLGDETFNIQLRPEARLAGIGLFTPLHLSGTFADPHVRPDPIAAAQANAGMLVGLAQWLATPFTWAAQTLGIIDPGGRQRDICTGPLIQGRATEAALQTIPPLPPLRLDR